MVDSPILDALYRGQGDEAQRLATGVGAASLSVFEAAALGDVESLQLRIAADRDQVNAWASDGFQPLALACFFGRRAAAELLVGSGAEINSAARNAFKVMPLHAALAGPDPEIARLLIAAGADVNARQQGGVTPLHEAAHIGNVELVRLLLEHGAEASATDDQGHTAADTARERSHSAVAEILP